MFILLTFFFNHNHHNHVAIKSQTLFVSAFMDSSRLFSVGDRFQGRRVSNLEASLSCTVFFAVAHFLL